MIKNLFLFIVIFFTIYILLIFKSPAIAAMIEDTLGFEGFNEFVLQFKGTFDDTVTNMPTKAEVINAYDIVYSGAIDLKDNFDTGLEITKNKIDSIRETLSGAEDTINDIKEGYDDAKEFIETNSGKLKEVQDTIKKVSEISDTLTNTGDTN